MPYMESLSVWAIPCKVVSCSTHKAVTFFMLVVVHCLCHSYTQALNDIWLRHPRIQRFRVRQEQLFLSKCCNPSCGSGVSPVLVSIGIRRPLLLSACICGLTCLHLLSQSVQCVKTGTGLSLSGSSAITNSRASHKLGTRP